MATSPPVSERRALALADLGVRVDLLERGAVDHRADVGVGLPARPEPQLLGRASTSLRLRARRRPARGRSRGSRRCSAGPRCRRPTRGCPSTARSRSASSMTMIPFLPPSSRWTCLRLSAAASSTATPVSREPVSVITGTSGWRTIRSPTSRPEAVHDVDDAGGTPGLDQQLDEALAEQRRVVRGLEHDGVAADERRHDLPGGDRDREVPRRDHADDADRLRARSC